MASYSENHPPDFRVSYSLISAEEGGRKGPHFQHIRWDFAYEDQSIAQPNQVFIIWPEFISATGEVLPKGVPMPRQGLADMYIVNPDFRQFHSQHIKLGVRGHFREGPHTAALCEVIEVLALHQNLKS